MAISSVTERVCRVQLVATQKSINRLGWWKGKFALFQMPATGRVGWGGQMSVQRLMAPKKPVGNQWGKSFYRQKEGATWRNSTVSSDSHLQIGHWWSDQSHLNCFR